MAASKIFRAIMALVVLSAFLAVSVAVLNAFYPMHAASELSHAFTESFRTGLATLVGLLVGHAVSTGQRQRQTLRRPAHKKRKPNSGRSVSTRGSAERRNGRAAQRGNGSHAGVS